MIFDIMIKNPHDNQNFILPIVLFFKRLNMLHNTILLNKSKPYIHGDMSCKNVLFKDAGDGSACSTFYILDYENVKEANNYCHMMDDYFQFISSIEFYAKLHGIDLVDKIKAIKNLGSQHYTFQKISPIIANKLEKKWKQKAIKEEIQKVNI